MKKATAMLLSVCISVLSVLTACGGTGQGGGSGGAAVPPAAAEKPAGQPGDTGKAEPSELSGTITVWGNEIYKQILPEFNKKYPNIKVEIPKVEDSYEKLLTALATGTGAPDIYEIGSGDYRNLKAVEGFEDLLQPPYNAAKYKNDFVDLQWELTTSFDGKRLNAFPFWLTPFVMFYRKDLVEENGFPSEPEEFGKFVADPENFFTMAKTLREKGHLFFRWTGEVTEVASSGIGYYDKNFNFIRDTEDFVLGLDYAKRAKQLDLVYPSDMTKDQIEKTANTGQMFAYFNTTSGINYVEKNAPNHLGKWRVTTLPFGKDLARGMRAFAITKQSKNKEAAWAWIEFMTTSPEANTFHIKNGTLPGYKPAWQLPAVKEAQRPSLGGQNLIEFAISRMDKLNYPTGHPLDQQAEELWDEKIDEVLEKNMDSRAAIQEIKSHIETTLSAEKAKLKKQAGM